MKYHEPQHSMLSTFSIYEVTLTPAHTASHHLASVHTTPCLAGLTSTSPWNGCSGSLATLAGGATREDPRSRSGETCVRSPEAWRALPRSISSPLRCPKTGRVLGLGSTPNPASAAAGSPWTPVTTEPPKPWRRPSRTSIRTARVTYGKLWGGVCRDPPRTATPG